MSSSLANKFQDHYSILDIDPKSNSEAIQQKYASLAQKFHPNNPDTGDKEKFDAVNLAYEVLSDLELRGEFDKLKGINQEEDFKFSGVTFFTALGRQSGLRATLLCILYDRRRLKPFTPSISMRIIESMLEATNTELSFAIWYLKQKDLMMSDDKSSLQITVSGMDFLEDNRPLPEVILPFIKPTSVVPAPGLSKTPIPAQSEESESVSKILNRALARR